MDTSPELNTVIQVTASAMNQIGCDVLGTEEQVRIIDLASKADMAWEDLPEHIRDCNDKGWDIEIVPRLVNLFWEDGTYEIHEIKEAIVDIIFEGWPSYELIKFIKIYHKEGRK